MVWLRLAVPVAVWVVSFSVEGPSGASTSAPARANQVWPSRPRKNWSLRPSHSPSMLDAPAEFTRINSGEPATTTVGVREMAEDWAGVMADSGGSRHASAIQFRIVLTNGESCILLSILAWLEIGSAGYGVTAGLGCAACHLATRSWTSSSSSVVMWVPIN